MRRPPVVPAAFHFQPGCAASRRLRFGRGACGRCQQIREKLPPLFESSLQCLTSPYNSCSTRPARGVCSGMKRESRSPRSPTGPSRQSPRTFPNAPHRCLMCFFIRRAAHIRKWTMTRPPSEVDALPASTSSSTLRRQTQERLLRNVPGFGHSGVPSSRTLSSVGGYVNEMPRRERSRRATDPKSMTASPASKRPRERVPPQRQH